VGWDIVVGFTKRQFQIANLLYVDFKSEFLEKNIPRVVMFQNVFMDPKILKAKQISLFFQCVLEPLCLFNFIHMFTCDFIQM
jgi:hypothetical protein